jgi:hypothetical protein
MMDALSARYGIAPVSGVDHSLPLILERFPLLGCSEPATDGPHGLFSLRPAGIEIRAHPINGRHDCTLSFRKRPNHHHSGTTVGAGIDTRRNHSERVKWLSPKGFVVGTTRRIRTDDLLITNDSKDDHY